MTSFSDLPRWAQNLYHDLEVRSHTAEYEMERLTYEETAQMVLDYYDE